MRTINQTDDLRYTRARQRVEALKGFYIHLFIYLVFIPVFIGLNLISGRFPWAIFPIAGWGIGVIAHAAETFSWMPFFGKDWESRKIQQFMEEDEIRL